MIKFLLDKVSSLVGLHDKENKEKKNTIGTLDKRSNL